MSELTFSPAADADIPVIFSMCKDLIDTYEDTDSIDYERVMAWVGKKLQKQISDYTCVMQNGEKVGYYHLSKEPDGWELDDVYVLPLYRSQGIGSRILKHCIDTVNDSIYLYVFLRNRGAIRLYEKFGFTPQRKLGNTRMIMRREG